MSLDIRQLLQGIPQNVASRSSQELHGHQYQITNLPLPLPEDDEDPVLSFELMMQVPELKLLGVSSYDIKDYDPLGGEAEDLLLLDNIMTVLECGDKNLLMDLDEFESWEWFQYVPAILRGEHPDWRIMGMTMDISGADFCIMEKKPLPDGRANLCSFMIDPDIRHIAAVETADGVVHTYIQNYIKKKQTLWVKHPNGSWEMKILNPSQLKRCQTRIDTTYFG